MFAFWRRKKEEPSKESAPIELPLTNIQAVHKAGICYLDSQGNATNLSFSDAYKGFCKSKNIKRSKLKYVCDRTKQDFRRFVFHTNPKVVFYATQQEEQLWIDTLNQITLTGYATFDFD